MPNIQIGSVAPQRRNGKFSPLKPEPAIVTELFGLFSQLSSGIPQNESSLSDFRKTVYENSSFRKLIKILSNLESQGILESREQIRLKFLNSHLSNVKDILRPFLSNLLALNGLICKSQIKVIADNGSKKNKEVEVNDILRLYATKASS